MTAFDNSTRRVATAVAIAAGAAFALSGCSAGQVTQTSSQVAAVNGNSADLGAIDLRNVHVQYPNSEEYSIEPGGNAVLAFTAINNSLDTPDKLTGITTEFAGTVVIAGEAGGRVIAPATSLSAGAPADAADPDHAAEAEAEKQTDENADAPSDLVLVVMQDLEEGVRPGLTVPVTFTFEKAGAVTVAVPVDAGHETERHVSEQSPVEGTGGH